MKKFYTLLATAALFTTTALAQIAAPEGTWKLSRTGWQVTAMNETPLGKEPAPSGPVAAAWDDDYTSFYHSNWADGSGKNPPQAIMVKLAEPVSVAGLIYATRMNAQGKPMGNGALKGYDVYVSNEAFSFDNLPAEGTGAAQGELDNVGEQAIKFTTPVVGQYVLLVYRSGHPAPDGLAPQYFNCSELNVLTDRQPGSKQYSVNIVGAPTAKVTVNNKAAGNGEQVSFVGELSAADVKADEIPNYASTISVNAATNTVKVVYHLTNLEGLSNNTAFYVGNVDAATRGTWYVKEGETKLSTNKKAGIDIDMNDPRQQFALIKSEIGNYYLFSVGAQQFISDDGSYTKLTNDPKGEAQIKPSGVEAAPWSIQVSNQMLNCNASAAYEAGVVTNWNTADNGNRYFLVNMGTVELSGALAKIQLYEMDALTAQARELSNKGMALFALSGAVAVDNEFKKAFMDALELPTNSVVALKKVVDALTAAIDNVKPVIKNGYYKLSNSAYGADAAADEEKVARFMAVDATNKGKTVAEEAGAQQIWKITSKGNGKYTLQNAATGAFAKISSPLTEEEVELNAGINADGLLTFGGESGNNFLHSQFQGENLVGWTKDAAASQWTLTPVENIELIGTNAIDGYFTFSAPFATKIPEEAQAFTVTKGEKSLVLSEIKGTIPANTGVLILGFNSSYNFEIAADVPAVAANELKPSLTPFALSAGTTISTLQKSADVLGFHPSTATAFKPYTAFMPAEADGTAKSWPLLTVDGIQTAQQAKATAIFDLSGRRVNEAKGGFFIINGKKSVVK